ncbi:Uncharacterised protein [Pandoraea pnomenusa]|uniref:Uncharacterized protein n=1 Tax=Pandoraea pnomenusa TaxID=93220 RepID=A0A379KD56_9BURK|nr:hypothetical protein [Pandoraea pnomenusa]SUD65809.1 Uncharacterised protein [Pandoraea pnomenusa]
MAGLTKAQKAEKAAAEARAKALAVAGVTRSSSPLCPGTSRPRFWRRLRPHWSRRRAAANGDDDGPELVTMIRDADLYDGPHEAQVHPDEVDNYRVGGWRRRKC